MANIGIVGAGNLAANAAFFIAEQDIAPVLFYDQQEGLATGKALDLMEAAPVREYQHPITAVDSLDALSETDLLVIAPASERQAGDSDAARAAVNGELITSLATRFAGYGGVVLVAADPTDAMTFRFQRRSTISPQRVLGLGAVVDAMRLRALIARELQVTTENVSALVVGGSADHAIPLFDYSRISGIAAPMLLDDAARERISRALASREADVLRLLQRSAAYYGPAAAVAEVARAVMLDTNAILPVSSVLDGPLGMSGVALSLPAIVGRNGIGRVLEPKLTSGQVDQLKRAAAQVGELAAV